jgi:hypothetical protein
MSEKVIKICNIWLKSRKNHLLAATTTPTKIKVLFRHFLFRIKKKGWSDSRKEDISPVGVGVNIYHGRKSTRTSKSTSVETTRNIPGDTPGNRWLPDLTLSEVGVMEIASSKKSWRQVYEDIQYLIESFHV